MIQAINQTHHTNKQTNKHLHLQSHSPMESSKMTDATTITIPESRRTHSKGKGLALDSTPITTTTTTTKAAQIPQRGGGWKRGVAIFDFVLRFVAIAAALSATTIMGTAGETLPFFTQFFQFEASYDDLPTFTFFVIANAMVSGYLVLSLPFSVVCIVRPRASAARFLLIILDTVMVALTIAAAAAATSIVYLAHNGNQGANWLAICNQFGDFCQTTSEAVVASFICAFILMALVVLSAFALRKH